MSQPKPAKIPEGFVLEVYVRPSVSIVINADRHNGGELSCPAGEVFPQLLFGERYKHYRRAFSLPGANLVQAMVAAGELAAPSICGYTRCMPDLEGARDFFRHQVLPKALAWDVEQGFLPDFDYIADLLVDAICQELARGNQDKHFEFLTFEEMVQRILDGTG